MSVFAYDPNAAKAWANSVINYLNGGSESIQVCSTKFNGQIEKLVQPNVWTGAAAAKNYQNFMDVHKALAAFTNSFGGAFEQAMNSINSSVAQLEVANLGGNTNVASSFGSLDYSQLTALSEQNINVEVVRYDYATIQSIGAELKNIVGMVENVHVGLQNKIKELNNGSSIWDGSAAESAKANLLNTLDNNMAKIKELLNVCVANITNAAEAAQQADRG